ADNINRSVTLDASGTLGLAPARIFYTPNDISRINLNSGSGNDTFFVLGTAGLAPVQINGLGGNDTFVVGNNRNTLDDILTPLQLNGNSGFDTLIVNDQGSTVAHTYTNQPGQITRSGGGGPTVTINFSSFESAMLRVGPRIGSPRWPPTWP